METTKVYQTKRNTYINFGGTIFITNNNWENRDFRLANDDEKSRPLAFGWIELADQPDIDSAYTAYIGHLKFEKEKRDIINIERKERFETIRNAENTKLEAMISVGAIPTTVENVRLLLNWLNGQNWGGWKLPPMTIGYSAAQHDCDGSIATTIKLDSGISDENGLENETQFVVGAPRGYLNKYQRI